MKLPILPLLLLCVSLTSSSCSFKGSKNWSLLIIGVENLGFEDLSCSEGVESKFSGFKALCQESVYFTHAYLPSTYAAANIASLLTGQYPFEHLLRSHHTFLNERNNSLAEYLVQNQFRTSFFSSGGSIFRKKGLDQGFEKFIDKIKYTSKKLYISSDQINNQFEKWMNETKGKRNFSFLYYSDPLFKKHKTVTNDKVERSLTRSSQIEEVSESVSNLINYLKDQKKWDNTFVIFTGLSGVINKEILHKFDNLYSENTRIPLLIKPPRKKRDLGINWTIDKNISLVDVGVLLRNFFGIKKEESISNQFDMDLKKSLISPVSNWPNERPLILESAWINETTNLEEYKYALRIGSVLYLPKEDPEIYNSLIDQQEIIPASTDSYLYKKIQPNIKSLRLDGFDSWFEHPELRILSDFVYQFWFDKSEINHWPIEFLIEESKNNSKLFELLQVWLLDNQKWATLIRLEEIRADGDIQHVLSQKDKSYKKTKKMSNCFSSFLIGDKVKFYQNCKDKISMALWGWKYEKDIKNKKKKLKKFIRLYINVLLAKQIATQNIAYNYTWFTPEIEYLKLSWLDKILLLDEYKDLKIKIENTKY